MSLKLYVDSQFTSPYAISAFVALREKGLDFELETVDMEAGKNKELSYTGKALTGRVPCLVHNDFMLTESSAITEYLDEMFPAPEHRALYPVLPQKRAVARQIQAWVRSDLGALREERSTYTVFYRRAEQPLSSPPRRRRISWYTWPSESSTAPTCLAAGASPTPTSPSC